MNELHRRQDEICASELRFRSVVQSATEAIILSDENGNVIFWNNGAEQIFGYSEEEILGASIATLMPESYRAAHLQGFERFRVTGRAHLIGRTVELEGLRKDGSVFPLEISLASWTTGGATMFTAIIRDVTERRQTDELRSAKDDAEEASRAKSAALARMSHELRTPLQAIVGFTTLLMQNSAGNLTPQDLDFLERILLNAKDQLQLINSILDLSKVEAGRMDVHLDIVPIDSIIRDVAKQLESERQSFDVQLVLRMPPVVRPTRTDPQKLKQVLINLVDNALKFTKQGMITIDLSVGPDLAPTRIDVSDTGVGMPPERISEIFEPFRQLASGSKQTKGTGLGLSICRSFCDLMGYELQVHSEPGRGSTFSVLLVQRDRLPISA
jgi:two-component system sensor histidine kinase/response regulator